ncbi:MAG: hypothetical protein LBJ25_01195 [Candidatus Margulisbacteria bacterium]|jgi:hypothetical protein|nr:hypothetical protein [Candidatus Margulisiibacteriota bacterium]
MTQAQRTQAINDLTAKNDVTQKEAKEYLGTLAGQNLKNDDTGIVAQINTSQKNKLISNKSVDRSISNGFSVGQHNAAIKNIVNLWKHSLQIENRTDRNNQPGVRIKKFIVPMKFADGKIGYVNLLIKESGVSLKDYFGHRIYTLELNGIEAFESIVRKVEANSNRQTRLSNANNIIARLRSVTRVLV